ncbi:MAG TPA: ATP-binding protein [Myxococcota bacterium]|nr:ATP-binding protein [Myxococcota bacterium]
MSGDARSERQGDSRIERQILILMAARLALATGSLVLGLALESVGGHITSTEWHGFYGAVVVAFMATLVYWPLQNRVRDLRRFAAVNIATDTALVSALVLFSGGGESVFTFLYVAVIAYAAMLLERGGAIIAALAAAAAYAAVLLADYAGLASGSSEEPGGLLLIRWVLHGGALLLVSVLATRLVGELERAGAALSQRTSALAQLQNLHERTVESLMSGLLTTDAQGRITSFNLEAERITGLGRVEACGRDLDAVLPGLRELIGAAGAPGSDLRSRMRMRFLDRSGAERHLGIGAYLLRGDEQGDAGLVVIFQDLSSVVQMERELRRSERLAAVGELSASIAHEIRNPLAAISGSVQILQKMKGAHGENAHSAHGDDAQSAHGDEAHRLMDIALRETLRLDRLIADFLTFARPAPLRAESVSLARVVDETLEAFEAARPPNVRIERAVDERLAVQADPGQLRQVLWNLVINACQAMPQGGVLRVAATAQGGGRAGRMEPEAKPAGAEIAVMDQGVGIAEDALEHVFDPFFTTKPDGSGLGLAIVHRVVSEHGGSVRIERGRAPWSTVVRVLLPSAELQA